MRLAGKTAIVTGAGNGIGRAIAERFAREGAKVLLADLEADAGGAATAAINAAGGTAIFEQVDVANQNDTQRMADRAVAEFGGIDILVNNAAAFLHGHVENVKRETWLRVLAVNLIGPSDCVRVVLPSMRSRGGGAIVNIASVSGFIAQPAFVPYNSSKGAVLQLTRCLAMDLAVDKIRVNSVCPGAIRTRASDLHIQSLNLDPVQAYQEFAACSPMGRMGEPSEIANAALFLASDEASFITGTELVVDGGATID